MQESRELLDAATRGEWMLEHDKKVLEIMQNLASVCDIDFLSFILSLFLPFLNSFARRKSKSVPSTRKPISTQ